MNRPSSLKSLWLYPFLLCVVTLCAFWPVLCAPLLQWDDDTHIYENPQVVSFDLKEIFLSTVHKTYIPLTTLTFAVEHRLFGVWPLVYHLDNLLLHIAVTFLIFRLARRMGLAVRAAFLSALVFAIHPMHVESVAWATERKDVLYALFYLLAMDRYWSYLGSSKRGDYAAAFIFGFLSMLAKPMALSLPLILCLLDFWKQRTWTLRVLLEKIPFLVYAAGLGWVTYYLNARVPQTSFAEAAALWLWSWSFYLTKFLWPAQLLALYQPPLPVVWSQVSYVCAAIIVVLFCLSLYWLRQVRLWVFAALFFLASLFFLFRFDHTIVDLSFVADRYMYLPSLGFCLVAGYGADQWLLRLKGSGHLGRLGLVTVVVVLIVMGIKTRHQATLWTDELRLWNAVVAVQPISSAYDNLGIVHSQRGDHKQAIELYTKALSLKPQDTVRTLNNRGVAYMRDGQWSAALEDFNRSTSLGPEYEWAYLNRALVWVRLGQRAQAIEDVRRALGNNPHNAAARAFLHDLKPLR